MNFSAVSKDDLKHMAQVVNTLHAGAYTLGGKDICTAADSIRWLQQAALRMSQSFQGALYAEKTPVTPSGSGLPEGVTIKAFHPGKPGKASKK